MRNLELIFFGVLLAFASTLSINKYLTNTPVDLEHIGHNTAVNEDLIFSGEYYLNDHNNGVVTFLITSLNENRIIEFELDYKLMDHSHLPLGIYTINELHVHNLNTGEKIHYSESNNLSLEVVSLKENLSIPKYTISGIVGCPFPCAADNKEILNLVLKEVI